ncbi:MAG: hypothetical protein PHZ09_14525 [Eubacteriales bacterium]|nr:hypothetical protein [Eubacteriales bacterium]
MYIKRHAEETIGKLDSIQSVKRGPGGVICLYDNLVSLTDKDRVIPVKYL